MFEISLKTVHGGKVIPCNNKFVTKSFQEVSKVLKKSYAKDWEIFVLFEKKFEQFNTTMK